MRQVTLQEFLSRCAEMEIRGDVHAGLLLCDQLLDKGVRGRFRAEVLRYKAIFMLTANEGWGAVAIGHLKEALPLTRRHPAARAALLNTLVVAYALAGSYAYARPYVEQFMTLAKAHSTTEVSRWTPKLWFNLGYCYDTAGRMEEAADSYVKAIETAHLAEGGFNLGYAKHNLVQVYLAMGRVEEAHALLQAARQHLDESRFGSFVLDQEAQCLLAMGQHESARQQCRLALAHPSCTERVQAEIHLTMARIAMADGSYREAVEYADSALALAIRFPVARLINRIERLRVELQGEKEVS